MKAEITYEVQIGVEWRNFIQPILRTHKKVLVIAPAKVIELAAIDQFVTTHGLQLFETPDAEEQKNIHTVSEIWNLLGESEFGRTDAIIAIGGGATTDLGGFVAATWLRGISWYAVPTTLAGMVDASIGGKTGINTGAGKNLVGSFYSPRAVAIDISWLDSLSDRDFAAGLAEVIKTGFIRDTSIIEMLQKVGTLSEARTLSQSLIEKSVCVKAAVVSADFKEGKLREILNFGHTLGHAIERKAGYILRHGEAVSIGLHFAALLSEDALGLAPEVTAQLRSLLERFELPTLIDSHSFPWSELFETMAGDKKSRDGRIRFIGIKNPGDPDWIESASADLLASTYEKILL